MPMGLGMMRGMQGIKPEVGPIQYIGQQLAGYGAQQQDLADQAYAQQRQQQQDQQDMVAHHLINQQHQLAIMGKADEMGYNYDPNQADPTKAFTPMSDDDRKKKVARQLMEQQGVAPTGTTPEENQLLQQTPTGPMADIIRRHAAQPRFVATGQPAIPQGGKFVSQQDVATQQARQQRDQVNSDLMDAKTRAETSAAAKNDALYTPRLLTDDEADQLGVARGTRMTQHGFEAAVTVAMNIQGRRDVADVKAEQAENDRRLRLLNTEDSANDRRLTFAQREHDSHLRNEPKDPNLDRHFDPILTIGPDGSHILKTAPDSGFDKGVFSDLKAEYARDMAAYQVKHTQWDKKRGELQNEITTRQTKQKTYDDQRKTFEGHGEGLKAVQNGPDAQPNGKAPKDPLGIR